MGGGEVLLDFPSPPHPPTPHCHCSWTQGFWGGGADQSCLKSSISSCQACLLRSSPSPILTCSYLLPPHSLQMKLPRPHHPS